MANNADAIGSPMVRVFERTVLDEPNRPQTEPTKNSELAQELQNNRVQRQQDKQAEQREEDVNYEDLVKSVNNFLQSETRAVRFKVDERDGQMVTSVFNQETDELIREIPNEDLRDLDNRLREMQGSIDQSMGLFVDKLV
jgi:flagellar protein FlaG